MEKRQEELYPHGLSSKEAFYTKREENPLCSMPTPEELVGLRDNVYNILNIAPENYDKLSTKEQAAYIARRIKALNSHKEDLISHRESLTESLTPSGQDRLDVVERWTSGLMRERIHRFATDPGERLAEKGKRAQVLKKLIRAFPQSEDQRIHPGVVPFASIKTPYGLPIFAQSFGLESAFIGDYVTKLLGRLNRQLLDCEIIIGQSLKKDKMVMNQFGNSYEDRGMLESVRMAAAILYGDDAILRKGIDDTITNIRALMPLRVKKEAADDITQSDVELAFFAFHLGGYLDTMLSSMPTYSQASRELLGTGGLRALQTVRQGLSEKIRINSVFRSDAVYESLFAVNELVTMAADGLENMRRPPTSPGSWAFRASLLSDRNVIEAILAEIRVRSQDPKLQRSPLPMQHSFAQANLMKVVGAIDKAYDARLLQKSPPKRQDVR